MARDARAYSIEEIGDGSHAVVAARALNNHGVVAGRVDNRAFTWDEKGFVYYDPLPFGMPNQYSATATGINDAGFAVGHEGDYGPIQMSGLVTEAAVKFSRTRTAFIFINPSYGQPLIGEAAAVNDAGTIVGVTGFRGFVKRADGESFSITPLSTRAGNNGTRATALDNRGNIVGGTTIDVATVREVQSGIHYSASGKPELTVAPDPNSYFVHAFIASFSGKKQKMRDLGAPFGYPDTLATGINDALTVVGYSGTQSKPRNAEIGGPSVAWVWKDNKMTLLAALRSGDQSFAYGVNDSNVIVGCSGSRAVRWVDGQVEALDQLIELPAGWKLSCARAVNRSGAIVGDGTRNGRPAMFLLRPLA